MRPDEAEQQHEDEDAGGGDGELVLQEHLGPAPERAARLSGRQHAEPDRSLRLQAGGDRQQRGRRVSRGHRLRGKASETHRLTYLTRGSSTAYAMSARSDPITVARATTTVIPAASDNPGSGPGGRTGSPSPGS